MLQIDNNQKDLIENNAMSFATVNSDNTPNVIGVAFVKVVSDNKLLITDNYMSATVENIQKNNQVCLAVWNKDWNGCKILGTAEYFTSGEWKTYVGDMEENKGLSAKGAILITISQIIDLK